MAGLILPQERPIRLEVSQCPWALWRQHAAVVLSKIDEALQAYRFHWVSPRSVSTVPQTAHLIVSGPLGHAGFQLLPGRCPLQADPTVRDAGRNNPLDTPSFFGGVMDVPQLRWLHPNRRVEEFSVVAGVVLPAEMCEESELSELSLGVTP
jgi:hypothetical protein